MATPTIHQDRFGQITIFLNGLGMVVPANAIMHIRHDRHGRITELLTCESLGQPDCVSCDEKHRCVGKPKAVMPGLGPKTFKLN